MARGKYIKRIFLPSPFEKKMINNNMFICMCIVEKKKKKRLKGQFSRLKFQQSLYKLNEVVVIRDLKVDLPVNSKDIYYRDEIGNVSTSGLRYERDKTVLQFRPRYPLFGGWNYTWYHGYNLPIENF